MSTMTLLDLIGSVGAGMMIVWLWAAIAWIGFFAWWLVREGRCASALRGMRYAAYAFIVAGSGAVACATSAGLTELALSIAAAAIAR